MKDLNTYLLNNKKKYLIFDFDETLFQIIIDWGKYITELNQEINSKLNISQRVDPFHDEINQLVEQFGQELKDIIIKKSQSFELEEIREAIPNKSLVSLIPDLAKKYSLFIWSSNTNGLIEKVLKQNNLDQFFKLITGKDNIKFEKPRIDGFKRIVEFTKDSKEANYLMIGNSVYSDKGAAENAGIEFFLIDYF